MKYIKIKFIALITTTIVISIVTSAYPGKHSIFKNLTIRINTDGDDYAPSLTEDGKTAVFNSRMPQEKSHNIFICKNKNGLWGDPYPIFEKKTDSNDETPFISADGKTIIFASDRPGGFSPPVTSEGTKKITFDLYISRLVKGKWTEPEILKGTVNSTMNERAPGLSKDGKTLFFTRWSFNNPGKSKIYSAKLEDGGFIDVKALPETINKGNYEIGFRQSYKSGLYYFASRKSGGFGAWDIYYTTKTGKGFTTPINAGKLINTKYDDMYYTESKINSIICSDRAGGFGKFDLYSSVPANKTTAKHIKHKDTENSSSSLRIKVIDKDNGKLLKNNLFRILLMGDREKESLLIRKILVKSSNKGAFTLSPKDDVDSVVIKPVSKNYSGCSVKIDIKSGQSQDITIYFWKKSSSNKTISCAESEINSSGDFNEKEKSELPTLKVIYYKFNSSEIGTEYIPELQSLVEFMRLNPEFKITISGYSDPAGSDKINEDLSMNRAKNAAAFIKSLGINEDRITTKWFGESKSISWKNGTRYYAVDRKVDLMLLQK